MRNEVQLKLFVIVFFALILTTFASAANTCSDSSQVMLRLSADTNAHAELFNGAGSYDTEICYNQIFSNAPIPGTRACVGDNTVIRLSASTNAHAEDPALGNYGTRICYRDLDCTLKSTCSGNEVEVLRLSSDSNAHVEISGEENYPLILCCTSQSAPGLGCNPSCKDGQICSNGNCVDPPTNSCGNGVINPGEGCDGNNFNGETCTSLTGNSGQLVCRNCIIDTSQCGGGTTTTECNDGVDNDGDSLIDFPQDPGCVDSQDDDETNNPTNEQRVYWANTNNNELADGSGVKVGDSVNLVAIGVPAGVQVRFTILDRDGLSEGVFDDEIATSPLVTESGGSAVYRWNIVPSDFADGLSGDSDQRLELYFIAEATSYDETSPTLYLTEDIDDPTPDDFRGCDRYNDPDYVSTLNGNPSAQSACNQDIGRQVGNDPGYSAANTLFNNDYGIGCNEETTINGRTIETSCLCAWENDVCVFDSTSTINLPDDDGDGVVCSADCDNLPQYGECINNLQTISSSGQLTNVNNCSPKERDDLEEQCLEGEVIKIACGAPKLLLPFFDKSNFWLALMILLGMQIFLGLKNRSQSF